MPEVTIGSMINTRRNITVSGFKNTFTLNKVFIDRYRVTHYGIFDLYTRVFITESKTILGAVNNLLIFLADKEQEDLDLFIKLSK